MTETPGVRPLRPDDPAEVDGYRLVGVLGEGGQGRVYLAEPPDGGERVALKVLLPETAADAAARGRMGAQYDLTQYLPRTLVVRLLAVRLEAEPPYLVSVYVPGPSLADRVRASGPLDGAELARLMVDTLVALNVVHWSDVVHHDLKPANLLLGPDGPRIADFDLAVRTGESDPHDGEDGVLGSAAFLAPERLDAGPAVRASDVFAWAATMAYAATGRSPFHAADVAGVVDAIQHRPPDLRGVPPELIPLLSDCLHKDPGRRPTVGDALERLTDALELARAEQGGVRADAVAPWGTPPTLPGPTSPGPPGPAAAPVPVAAPVWHDRRWFRILISLPGAAFALLIVLHDLGLVSDPSVDPPPAPAPVSKSVPYGR